ncbi:hypothetical protein TNCV_4542331 [Trichonephila clavipes]|nr:hypothetical protein TNCV_4542331 [Trichonephila clavipes]
MNPPEHPFSKMIYPLTVNQSSHLQSALVLFTATSHKPSTEQSTADVEKGQGEKIAEILIFGGYGFRSPRVTSQGPDPSRFHLTRVPFPKHFNRRALIQKKEFISTVSRDVQCMLP